MCQEIVQVILGVDKSQKESVDSASNRKTPGVNGLLKGFFQDVIQSSIIVTTSAQPAKSGSSITAPTRKFSIGRHQSALFIAYKL